ncbi:MAG: hypothetical protein ACYCT1_08160 [Steroidobacteraceae bacterium]
MNTADGVREVDDVPFVAPVEALLLRTGDVVRATPWYPSGYRVWLTILQCGRHTHKDGTTVARWKVRTPEGTEAVIDVPLHDTFERRI